MLAPSCSRVNTAKGLKRVDLVNRLEVLKVLYLSSFSLCIFW